MTCALLRDQALVSVLQPPWEHGSERSKITHRSSTFWEWQSNEKEAWAKITKDHYVRDINVSCVQDIAILILYFHSQMCFLSNRIPMSGESCGMSYLFLYPSPVNDTQKLFEELRQNAWISNGFLLREILSSPAMCI